MSSNIHHKKTDLINIISISTIFITSLIFFVKYSELYLSSFILPTILYVVIFLGIVVFSFWYDFSQIKIKHLKLFSIILLMFSAAFILVVPRIGNIGRLPAIVDWLKLLFDGIFPYTSDLVPSSFPFLFYLAIPFYFIGKIGFLEVIGLGLLFYLIFEYLKSSDRISFAIILLLITPLLYFEFVTRSELFFNITLLMFSIFLSEKYLEPDKANSKFVFIAIIFGLLLSTRSIAAILYGIYLLFKFRHNLKNLFIFGMVMITIFVLMILPYVIWDFYLFIDRGPFAVQTGVSQLPFWFMTLFLLLSFFAGWTAKNLRRVFFYSGLIIWILVITSFGIIVSEVGIGLALFEDEFDISYLILSFPLFIFSVAMGREESNTDDTD